MIKGSIEYNRRVVEAINTLREEEGEAVQIPNDNPDFGGPNNVIIWHRDFEDAERHADRQCGGEGACRGQSQSPIIRGANSMTQEKVITVRCSPELHAAPRELSYQRRTSLNLLCVKVLQREAARAETEAAAIEPAPEEISP